MRTRGRKTEANVDYETKGGGAFVAWPMTVLVDNGTASAAEALAGALQDHDRATILGRRTFGKALVQTAFPLPSGDVIWLTTARALTPSGRSIQRSYGGLSRGQYYAVAGEDRSEDTTKTYFSRSGRPLLGGGGIAPDRDLPAAAMTPAWWSEAFDRGLVDEILSRVSEQLSSDPVLRAALGDDASRQSILLEPLLERVREALDIGGEPGAGTRTVAARALAVALARRRWGDEAGLDLWLRTDPDIAAALADLNAGASAARR